MLVIIRDLPDLIPYLRHVERALSHHAEHLREIAPHIAWAVLSALDDDQPIEVHERRSASGHPAIAAAFWIGGQRYSLAYNRRLGGVVTLREGSRVRPVIWTLDEHSTPADVRAVFDTLRAAPQAVAAA